MSSRASPASRGRGRARAVFAKSPADDRRSAGSGMIRRDNPVSAARGSRRNPAPSRIAGGYIRRPPRYCPAASSQASGRADRRRTMVAEATGGPTWYTEFNVVTGLSARSFGDLKFYVTRIAAGRVTRGLPGALQRCGYKTVSLYPTYGDFLSARTFQKAAGVEQFIDMADM